MPRELRARARRRVAATGLTFDSSWALADDAAIVLAELVLSRRPSLIVELGAGLSTVLLGHLLRDLGHGRLLSLEEDRRHAESTRRELVRRGLADRCEVIDAPLAPRALATGTYAWYALPEPFLGGLGQAPVIDLLVVDGPANPPEGGGWARYPALPVLDPLLAAGAIVFVDDVHRDGERRMVAAWLEEFPEWHAREVNTTRGLVLMERAASAAAIASHTPSHVSR